VFVVAGGALGIGLQGDINLVYLTAVVLLFKSGGLPQLNRQCLLD
jgi:hypothetical protein